VQKRQESRPRPTLRTLAVAVRFVVRMQMGAREWAKHEVTRRRLAEKVDEMRRAKRSSQLRLAVA